MDEATIALLEQIGSVLFQAVEAGIKYGPSIIADLKLAYQLATSGTTLTDDQKQAATTALESAHAALQAQLDTDIQTDATANVDAGTAA